MNERIEKLYQQAEKSVQFLSNSKESKQRIVTQNFAELIVQECANYASRNWEHGHLLAQDLKTHFRVE